MPPDRMILLLSCLLSTLTFAITFESLEIEASYLACILSYDALLSEIKVNDLVTLTLTFMLNIAFSGFVATRGIVFHKYIFCFQCFNCAIQ